MLPLKVHVLKESTSYVVHVDCKSSCWEALISGSLGNYSSVTWTWFVPFKNRNNLVKHR